MSKAFFQFFVMVLSTFFIAGCLCFRTSNAVPRKQDKVISHLKKHVKELNQELYNVELKKEKELQSLRKLQMDLKRKLEKEIGENSASVKMVSDRLAVRFLSKVFFRTGKSAITQQGKRSLDKIVRTLRNCKFEIRVEGHTDNRPIVHTKKFYRSNWELSAMRSLSVTHYLVSQGLPPEIFAVVAHGQHQPVASNKTAKGRTQNRRVEIVIGGHPQSFH